MYRGQTSYDIPINEKIPTGIWKDMMKVSGTISLMYFATETAETSKEGENYMVSLHFLHKCMVALIQVTKTARDTILPVARDARPPSGSIHP